MFMKKSLVETGKVEVEKEAAFHLPGAFSHWDLEVLVIEEEDWTKPAGLMIREGFLEEEAVVWVLKDK